MLIYTVLQPSIVACLTSICIVIILMTHAFNLTKITLLLGFKAFKLRHAVCHMSSYFFFKIEVYFQDYNNK